LVSAEAKGNVGLAQLVQLAVMAQQAKEDLVVATV
jgi:hypothetical protein